MAISDKYAALKADIDAAEQLVNTAKTALYDAMKADNPIQPGDIVHCVRKNKTAIVRRLGICYREVELIASYKLKNGEFSEHLAALYSFDGWEKV